MEEKTTGVEIRISDLWLILKRCWWLMLAVLLVVFAIVYIYANSTYEEEYTATAIVWALGTPNAGQTTTSDVSIGTNLINDYKQLVTTTDVLMEVIERAELPQIKPHELSKMVSISHESNTRVMYISVTAASATGAQKIANTMVDVFCERINSKNEDGKSLVTVWSDAELPTRPSNGVSALKLLLIAVVCSILVFGVYFVLYLMDDKINTAEDVERYLGLSMLGMIPNRVDAHRRHTKEAYRASMQSSGQGRKLQ